jgi:hypothetical protein
MYLLARFWLAGTLQHHKFSGCWLETGEIRRGINKDSMLAYRSWYHMRRRTYQVVLTIQHISQASST